MLSLLYGPTLTSVHDHSFDYLNFVSKEMSLLFNMLPRFVGEDNGTPLQYSCLENPMDGGAWWAAVHGVARVAHD